MESFLKLVAADLYKHTEGNLAHTAVVFPNKRAGLFFNEYLDSFLRLAAAVHPIIPYPFRNRGNFRFWDGFPTLWIYGTGHKNVL